MIVIHLLDEPGTPGVVFERQLILTTSFRNAKQSQIENLENLRRIPCEVTTRTWAVGRRSMTGGVM
jgi:hypothetical protein